MSKAWLSAMSRWKKTWPAATSRSTPSTATKLPKRRPRPRARITAALPSCARRVGRGAESPSKIRRSFHPCPAPPRWTPLRTVLRRYLSTGTERARRALRSGGERAARVNRSNPPRRGTQPTAHDRADRLQDAVTLVLKLLLDPFGAPVGHGTRNEFKFISCQVGWDLTQASVANFLR